MARWLGAANNSSIRNHAEDANSDASKVGKSGTVLVGAAPAPCCRHWVMSRTTPVSSAPAGLPWGCLLGERGARIPRQPCPSRPVRSVPSRIVYRSVYRNRC